MNPTNNILYNTIILFKKQPIVQLLQNKEKFKIKKEYILNEIKLRLSDENVKLRYEIISYIMYNNKILKFTGEEIIYIFKNTFFGDEKTEEMQKFLYWENEKKCSTIAECVRLNGEQSLGINKNNIFNFVKDIKINYLLLDSIVKSEEINIKLSDLNNFKGRLNNIFLIIEPFFQFIKKEDKIKELKNILINFLIENDLMSQENINYTVSRILEINSTLYPILDKETLIDLLEKSYYSSCSYLSSNIFSHMIFPKLNDLSFTNNEIVKIVDYFDTKGENRNINGYFQSEKETILMLLIRKNNLLNSKLSRENFLALIKKADLTERNYEGRNIMHYIAKYNKVNQLGITKEDILEIFEQVDLSRVDERGNNILIYIIKKDLMDNLYLEIKDIVHLFNSFEINKENNCGLNFLELILKNDKFSDKEEIALIVKKLFTNLQSTKDKIQIIDTLFKHQSNVSFYFFLDLVKDQLSDSEIVFRIILNMKKIKNIDCFIELIKLMPPVRMDKFTIQIDENLKEKFEKHEKFSELYNIFLSNLEKKKIETDGFLIMALEKINSNIFINNQTFIDKALKTNNRGIINKIYDNIDKIAWRHEDLLNFIIKNKLDLNDKIKKQF